MSPLLAGSLSRFVLREPEANASHRGVRMGHPREQQQRTMFCVYFLFHQSCDRNESKQGLCVHGCAYVHVCECTRACACVSLFISVLTSHPGGCHVL